MTNRESVIPPISALFSDEEWRQINHLSTQLNNAQKLWLSGFLLPSEFSIPSSASISQANTATDIKTASGQSDASILIAYGTETGNSEKLAHQLAEKVRAAGLPVRIANLAEMSFRQFAREKTALIICSTHGDGDPPEPIQEFYSALMTEQASSLAHLRYAVLALGDTSYLPFCETGKQIDQRLTQLGATALIARSDCDVDYQTPAELWMQASIDRLKDEIPTVIDSPAALTTTSLAVTSAATKKAAEKVSRNHPCRAQVLNNICLTHKDAATAIYHIELALAENTLSLQAGDAIGIFVKNPPVLVTKIIQLAGLDETTEVLADTRSSTDTDTGTRSLIEALSTDFDLVVAGKNFLTQWAQWSSHQDLKNLVAADFSSQREFLRSHQIIDIIERFPARASAQEFINSLRPLQPRLYDLASSPTQFDDEIHILVKEYLYPFKQRHETGIASSYLAGVKAGDDLTIYPHHNKKFHLPATDNIPLIFISTETGAAPYRAFLQEMKATNRNFPCWLIITGDAQKREVVYQLDWVTARKNKQLIYIDPVFYAEKNIPVVSEPLVANPERFLQWLLLGAEVYLCGDKEILQKCEADIEALVAHYSQTHPTHEEFSWRILISEGRVHRNLY